MSPWIGAAPGATGAFGEDSMTLQESLAFRIADALQACGINYLSSRSLASNYYGIPLAWCQRHGKVALLEEIRRSVPEI